MRCPFLCRILSIGHFSALCKQYLCTILHFCVLHNLRRCILVFFDILQTLCDEKGIAMSALLDSVGMSRGNIARWKNGLVPKSATKIKLANALGVDRSRLDDDQEGKRESSGTDILDEIDIAFYGDYKALDDEQKEILRDMARTMRRRREEKEGK